LFPTQLSRKWPCLQGQVILWHLWLQIDFLCVCVKGVFSCWFLRVCMWRTLSF
jgi:hypothetical protein